MTGADNEAAGGLRPLLREIRAAAAACDVSWLPPAASGWPLAPETVRFAMGAVRVVRPRHILEFGSGVSTRAFARAAAGQAPRCAISSIDHDPHYGAEARRAAERERPPDVRIAFQVAPLVLRDLGGQLLPAYALRPSALASRRPADLVLIDGPPEPLGGREGTLYQLMPYLRPGSLVLADDAERPHERRVLETWRDNFGDALEVEWVPGCPKGLAAVRVRAPVPPAQLWAHRARLTARDLAACTPPAARIVLADEGQWGAELAPGREVHPFIERNGESGGAPEDDAAALRALEAWRAAGVRYAAFAWPSFWWFDCYPELARALARCRSVLRNARLAVFDLADDRPGTRQP